MKQSEVVDLIKMIDRVYKTDYAGDGDIVKDWYKVLKNYDFSDMTKSLDYYMENYTEYPPKVYNLIKGYQTIETKQLLENAKTRCQFCGDVIDPLDNKHTDRCLSIAFIKNVARRFKNQEIDIIRYKKMDDKEFDKYHLSTVKLVVENSQNDLEVRMWRRYLDERNRT